MLRSGRETAGVESERRVGGGVHMSVAVVTGSAGLVGAEAARYYAGKGYDVVGIDNDMRAVFFGPEASTRGQRDRLEVDLPTYRHYDADVRDASTIKTIFGTHGADVSLVIHAAAQPSHDWAASDPATDFSVNANGTLVLLEAVRAHCPDATFIYVSTNKVYGDTPNRLPLVERETRWEPAPEHPFAAHGIDETMSIDHTMHSLFGVSKASADLLCQEYAHRFGLKTGIFRCGCLTGPLHAGAREHGFLAYLMKCAVAARAYTIHGYKGKQVRDNIHSHDLVRAFEAFHGCPRPGEVYNMGGSRFSHCSMREAIALCERITGQAMRVTYVEENRLGDHIWWISDVRKFQSDYPAWTLTYDVPAILEEIHEARTESAPFRHSRP